MKFVLRLLSVFGALAGVFYLAHRGISRAYENTIHRYVVFDDEHPNNL